VKRTIRRATNPETGKGTILILGKAKSQKSHRPIPIIPKSRAILEAQATMRAPGCDLVFHTDTDSPLEAGELRVSLARYVAAAKIKHIGMHSLRHTFATNALRAGVDMRTLSELLGHYDVAFTIRTYGHTDLTTKKHALEKMYGADEENE
jgi:integrase